MASQQITALLEKYPAISDQVDREDIRVILNELERTLERGIPGDVVEFGCYIGTTSLFIQRLLEQRRVARAFHVYDSFEGLPPKSRQDESAAGTNFRAGQLAVSKKQFVREFQRANLKPPIIHKGWFSDLTASDVPEHIAFAFLDGDFYESIRDSLRLVLPRMSKGGALVFHDYAREALPGVARATAEFGVHPRVVHGLGVVFR